MSAAGHLWKLCAWQINCSHSICSWNQHNIRSFNNDRWPIDWLGRAFHVLTYVLDCDSESDLPLSGRATWDWATQAAAAASFSMPMTDHASGLSWEGSQSKWQAFAFSESLATASVNQGEIICDCLSIIWNYLFFQRLFGLFVDYLYQNVPYFREDYLRLFENWNCVLFEYFRLF